MAIYLSHTIQFHEQPMQVHKRLVLENKQPVFGRDVKTVGYIEISYTRVYISYNAMHFLVRFLVRFKTIHYLCLVFPYAESPEG